MMQHGARGATDRTGLTVGLWVACIVRALAKKQLAAPGSCWLPRGGVAVGAEIARALEAPLDIVRARLPRVAEQG